MPRALRHQYAGAIYHVTARGDGGKAIFKSDEDANAFLLCVEQAHRSHGWRVHAWVLMDNHFHLLLETPEANLITGMRHLLQTFSLDWNARRAARGAVFHGRYKSVPISATLENPYFFQIVADYIHLNPARAGLAGEQHGKLVSYSWSSLPHYAKGKGPDWLEMARVLDACKLGQDDEQRRSAYIERLEACAENNGGKVDDAVTNALKRGWYIGEPSFGDQLRSLNYPKYDQETGREAVAKSHDEAGAEELAKRALEALGLPIERSELAKIRKGDEAKVLVSSLLRKHTSVSNAWLAARLVMGHTGSVSRAIATFAKDAEKIKRIMEIENVLLARTYRADSNG